MRRILYKKYNSLRKPCFRLSTQIVEEDGVRYVEKAAMCPEAKVCLDRIMDNYETVRSVYKSIKPVGVKRTGDVLRFDFVKGDNFLKDIDFENDAFDSIVEKLNNAFHSMFDYRPEYVQRFVMTDKFREVFPDCEVSEERKAFSISNIDAIFGNFVVAGDGVYSIDYEWMMDFPIPSDYIKFRSLLYLYNEKRVYFINRDIKQADLFAAFDFSDEDKELFLKMEEGFQLYVHGEDRKYIYTENYKKSSKTLDEMKNDYLIQIARIKEDSRLKIEDLSVRLEVSDKDNEKKQLHIDNLSKKNSKLANEVVLLKRQLEKLNYQMENEKFSRDKQLYLKQQQLDSYSRALKNPIQYAALAKQKLDRYTYFHKGDEKVLEERRRMEEIGKYTYLYGDLEKEYERDMDFETRLDDYEKWMEKYEKHEPVGELSYSPLITLIIPAKQENAEALAETINSVSAMKYENYELYVALEGSQAEEGFQLPETFASNDKLHIVYTGERSGKAASINMVLSMSDGEFFTIIEAGDTLDENALSEMVRLLNNDDSYDYIYSDEDSINSEGKRKRPMFKPDWSPDTFMSFQFTGHMGLYKKSTVENLGVFSEDYENAFEYDMILRIADSSDNIGHVSEILYHKKETAEEEEKDKEWDADLAGSEDVSRPDIPDVVRHLSPEELAEVAKIKEAALARRKVKGETFVNEKLGQVGVNYSPENDPLVSIIIPSKDNYDILKRCVESIDSITGYKNYEIILIDNGSNEENHKKYDELSKKFGIRYIYEEMPFNFSRMCNIGAAAAKGEILLFLNDDTEVLDEEWLGLMAGHAMQPHVGAVGAKLLYPNGIQIQHAGVVFINSGPSHVLVGINDHELQYMNRNRMDYNYMAVTGACLMVSKDKYYEVGGFDEDLAVAYNDIDLCLKFIEQGYYNVVKNDVILIHHESVSRGDDSKDEAKFERLSNERKQMYRRHPLINGGDMCYNKNLDPNSVYFKFDMSVATGYKKVAPSDITEERAQYQWSIDETITDAKKITISGWAFIKGYESTNELNIKILLTKDDSMYLMDTIRRYRGDVSRLFIEESDVRFTGFYLSAFLEDMEPGTYSISIITEKGRMDTEKKIRIY